MLYEWEQFYKQLFANFFTYFHTDTEFYALSGCCPSLSTNHDDHPNSIKYVQSNSHIDAVPWSNLHESVTATAIS